MTEEAMRFNTGKAKLSYMMSAPAASKALCEVMEYGAKKYARDNWKKGMKLTEISDSLLRHLEQFLSGEDRDEESGCLHVGHIMANAMFLAEISQTMGQYDDRPKPKTDLEQAADIANKIIAKRSRVDGSMFVGQTTDRSYGI